MRIKKIVLGWKLGENLDSNENHGGIFILRIIALQLTTRSKFKHKHLFQLNHTPLLFHSLQFYSKLISHFKATAYNTAFRIRNNSVHLQHISYLKDFFHFPTLFSSISIFQHSIFTYTADARYQSIY